MNLEDLLHIYVALPALWILLAAKVVAQMVSIVLLRQKAIEPSNKLLNIITYGIKTKKQGDLVSNLKQRSRLSLGVLLLFLVYLFVSLILFAGQLVPMIFIAVIGAAVLIYGLLV